MHGAHTQPDEDMHIYRNKHAYIEMCTHAGAHKHIDMYVCTHADTHTHTHTHTLH